MSKAIRNINMIKEMPLDKVIRKVMIKMYRTGYHTYRKTRIKIKPIDLNDIYFENFEPCCNFIFDCDKKKYYVEAMNNIGSKENIVSEANRICEHVFNILGSGDIYLGEKLPWNKDFKTGFLWKNKFYKDIKIINLFNNSDVKVPWELSRFQHIFTLGKAYWLTDNEKYSQEFKDESKDWIEKNPVEMSVNWTCTMDVAIRAINWIIGFFFFRKSKSIDKEFWNKFNKSLYLHGRFIIKNLENEGKNKGNHYLSDIVGLIWLGIYFKDFSLKDKKFKNNPELWLDYGLKELEKEMFAEVNEDGTNYETSTAYHRLVTELFLITTILCSKNNIHFSKEYRVRLEKMCDFIMNITKPNGISPLIGDADDGRLIIFSNYSSWVRRDFRHILAVSGEYFDRDDFRYYGKSYKEDALWSIGCFKEKVCTPQKLKSTAYNNGGYYILRNHRIYCIIRCGELSLRGEGGHSHNDQLSFELNIDGEDFIVDPGLYVYTSDFKMRNLFRSTNMHNTISIEGYEQNEFIEDEYNLFRMKEESFGECIEFSDEKFIGRHYGYRSKCDVIHERSFKIYDNVIRIEDKVKDCALDKYKITSNLILNNDKKIVKGSEKLLIEGYKSNISLSQYNLNFINEDKVYLSTSYGKIHQTSRIKIEVTKNCNTLEIEIL